MKSQLYERLMAAQIACVEATTARAKRRTQEAYADAKADYDEANDRRHEDDDDEDDARDPWGGLSSDDEDE